MRGGLVLVYFGPEWPAMAITRQGREWWRPVMRARLLPGVAQRLRPRIRSDLKRCLASDCDHILLRLYGL